MDKEQMQRTNLPFENDNFQNTPEFLKNTHGI